MVQFCKLQTRIWVVGIAAWLCWSATTMVRADDAKTTARTGTTTTSERNATSALGPEDAGHATASTRRDSADGTRVVQVIEDDKMIRIVQKPGRDVSVIVVETIRGEQKVNRYEARSPELLKRRQPRGFDLYRKYINGAPKTDVDADADDDVTVGASQPAVEARLRAEIAQLRRQVQQQMMMQRQANSRQQAGVQQQMQRQTGTSAARGAWAYGSARASASARSSASSRSSSSSSSSSSNSNRNSNGGR